MIACSRIQLAMWLRRGGAALAGFVLDKAIDSLELGRRCLAWIASPRHAAVVAVAVALTVATAWACGASCDLDRCACGREPATLCPMSVTRGWKLQSGEALHATHPAKFQIPPRCVRAMLGAGRRVKLIFDGGGDGGERMWVDIHERRAGGYVGRLVNQPVEIRGLHEGDRVEFAVEHIIDITPSRSPPIAKERTASLSRLLRDPERVPRRITRAAPVDGNDSGLRLLDGDEPAGFGGAEGDLSRVPLHLVVMMYEPVRALVDDRHGLAWRWNDAAGRYDDDRA